MKNILQRLIDNWKMVVVYGAVALLILLPLLGPGYILTLDMVFTPKLRMPDAATSSYLFHAALHVLNIAIPSQVIEKLLLFAILFLSGLGMHRLMRFLQPQSTSVAVAEGASYLSGLFYTINPYTYSRFMVGQYSVLLGYACLPFFVVALLRFLKEPSLRKSIALAAWVVGISVVSIHTLGLVLVVTLVAVCQAVWQYRADIPRLRRLAKYGLIAGLIFLVASSYWLFPLVRGTGATATSIATFRGSDQSAFATVGNGTIGKLVHVLRLQGFWGERQDLYLLPQDELGMWWGLFAICVWGFVVVGAIAAWRHKRETAIFLGSSVLIAILLAAGVGVSWLARHVPFFAGYREPQKFAAIIALGYAVFIGFAFRRVIETARAKIAWIGAVVVGLIVLVGFTPVMFRGFDGQLVPRQYPADWYAINQRLNEDHDTFQVLFLPWHLYMRYQFAGRVIANPGDSFFDKPTLVSDEPEFSGAVPAVPNAQKLLITRHILPEAPVSTMLGRQLAPLRVKYVLLAKDFDYQTYGYLGRQTDLRLVVETPTLKLYRNIDFGKASP